MNFDVIFSQNAVLGRAVRAAGLRGEIIAYNIANNDTPNFKKRAVKFESYLQRELDQARRTGTINLSRLEPSIRTIHQNYRYRLDGNNVDIEAEMVDLYQNAIRYETMIDSMNHNTRRFNLVLQGMR